VIPPRDRGRVQGVFAAVFGGSSVIGPLIGGWFVEAFSWHWIFFINLPLGGLAVAGFLASFRPTGERVHRSIDWSGAAALSLSLASLTLVTSLGGRSYDWTSPQMLGLAALALGAGAAFIAIERRAAEPILPLGLFRLNVFWVTSIIGFVLGAAMFGAVTFLPLFLQVAQGASPTLSGLMLVPMTVGIVASSTIAGQYMGRTGRYRGLPILGSGFLILGMLLLGRLEPDTSVLAFSLSLGCAGFGMGCLFPVLTTAVQNAVPHEVLGTATAAGLMFRQVGGSLAVAVFGAIFASRLASAMGGFELDAGEIGPQTMAGLPEELRAAVALNVADALRPVFWIAAALGAVGLLFSFVLEEVPLENRTVPRGE
jgi:MFS family permease